MKNFDKEEYARLKAKAKSFGVKTVSKELDLGLGYAGITIAYELGTLSEDVRMLAVSVSYCAMEDEFKKKIGKYQAYTKLTEGEYVQLPLGQFYKINGKEATDAILMDMFAV